MENGTGLKIFSGKSNEPLAKEICSYLGVPLGDALVTSFPDNESFVRFNENIRGTDVFLVQSTSSPANHNVMELLHFQLGSELALEPRDEFYNFGQS